MCALYSVCALYPSACVCMCPLSVCVRVVVKAEDCLARLDSKSLSQVGSGILYVCLSVPSIRLCVRVSVCVLYPSVSVCLCPLSVCVRVVVKAEDCLARLDSKSLSQVGSGILYVCLSVPSIRLCVCACVCLCPL
jgi:hypothetical protein